MAAVSTTTTNTRSSSPIDQVMSDLLASAGASDDSLSSEASYSYEYQGEQLIRTKKVPALLGSGSPITVPTPETSDDDIDIDAVPPITRPANMLLSRSTTSLHNTPDSGNDSDARKQHQQQRQFTRTTSQPVSTTTATTRSRLKPVRPGKPQLDHVPEERARKQQMENDAFEKMSARFLAEREERKRLEIEEQNRRLMLATESAPRTESDFDDLDNEQDLSPDGGTIRYEPPRPAGLSRPSGPPSATRVARPLSAQGSADSYFAAEPYAAASRTQQRATRPVSMLTVRPRLSTKPEEDEEDFQRQAARTRPRPRTSESSEENPYPPVTAELRSAYNPPPPTALANGRRRGYSSSTNNAAGVSSSSAYGDRRSAHSETEGDHPVPTYRTIAPTRTSPPPRPTSAASLNTQSAPRPTRAKRTNVDDHKVLQHEEYMRSEADRIEMVRVAELRIERDREARELEWQMLRQAEEQSRYRPIQQRKDSETMRQPTNGEDPTVAPHRSSPSMGGQLRPNPLSSSGRHRRSPTAPSAAAASRTLEYKENKIPPSQWISESHMRPPSDLGHYSAGGFGEDLVNRADRDLAELGPAGKLPLRSASVQRQAVMPPPQLHQQQALPREQTASAPPNFPAQAMAMTPAPTDYRSKNNLTVNKRNYTRLNLLGKGGSSKVYRVLGQDHELYALKRVQVDRNDHETLKSYMNEIALLRRLQGHARIIQLVETEVKNSTLLLVMECGEIDLARLLLEKQGQPIQFHWIATYWQQMLEAVHVIHEEKIVHSDLKPANFVLVKGSLKLIDFGIANAIANDTTNIQRDNQIGTVNYMSPEAITVPATGRLKLGRASDIWSLGCILYQMIYSHPPFHALGMAQKLSSIPNEDHVIDFPILAVPTIIHKTPEGPQLQKKPELAVRVREDFIMSMRTCLVRNPKERATIPQLLDAQWLTHWHDESLSAAAPSSGIVLKNNEVIVDDHYMGQIIEHVLSHAQSNPGDMSESRRTHVAEQMTPTIMEELKRVTGRL